MATVYKVSFLFQVTTSPEDRAAADPHSGGWSEQHWTNTLNLLDSSASILAARRARMLPAQADCIGWRIQTYDIVGNKLLPGGSQTTKRRFPGAIGVITDLPQVALQMSSTGTGTINTGRFTLRCIPDSVMQFGEYQPDTAFAGKVKDYTDTVAGSGWGFVGRDLAQAARNVLSINNGVLTLSDTTGLNVGDYIRMVRVKTALGSPVSGAFRITAVASPNVTVASMPNFVQPDQTGYCRKDVLTYIDIATVRPVRAVVRKVGNPFERYRGRRSKRSE